MKFVKKITALFLALTMVMAMGITAFAAETYTISTKSDDTHTYSVYQILTGDLNDGVLSNVKAGSNYNTAKGDAAAAAEAIAAMTTTGQTLANAIAEYVNMGDGTTAYGTVSATSSLTNVLAGYYLIKDNGAAEGDTDSYSTYIVKVVGNVEINPKKDTPSFEKKVQDINDTTDSAAGNLQDSADYDIGDAVPFTLTGTVPSNYGDYSTYYYQFTDQMEKSLTFDKSSVKVYVDDAKIAEGFTVSEGSTIQSGDFKDGTQFTVTFEDLKKVNSVKAGSKIVVKYNATLNDNAVLGNQGNVNQAKLTYSNNPNQGGDGDKGNTPWDAVIVFTYQTVVNKVDQDKQALTGAQFTLYKKLKDGTTKEIKSVEITANKDATPSTFTFKGLDDGDYVLKETKTPDGYNTVADIEFTITATHNVEWKNGKDRTTILTELKGGSLGDGTVSAGTITTSVENRKGSTLPSTGGMGTTVLYIAGIAMIVVAGVVVIARKRNA